MTHEAVAIGSKNDGQQLEENNMPERLQDLTAALSRLEKIAKKPRIFPSGDSTEQGEYIKLLESENLDLSKKMKTVLTVQKALEMRCDELETLLATTEKELTGAIREIDEAIAHDTVS
jgi:hypothetical protein